MNMRRLASSSSGAANGGGAATPSALRRKRSMRGDLMKDVEKEAEQRLVNATYQVYVYTL